jgi:O-antigen biosynthesis protein WbqP
LIRFFDILISFICLFLFSPLLIILTLFAWVETGSPIFRQVRVGRKQKPFKVLKFRTMYPSTQSMATHLVDKSCITRVGKYLRNTKLDELPQFLNVLIGDMSLVGPRPCLPNQKELLAKRIACGIFEVRPGITGLAQIRSIDMSKPTLLTQVDLELLNSISIRYYFRILFLTIYKLKK